MRLVGNKITSKRHVFAFVLNFMEDHQSKEKKRRLNRIYTQKYNYMYIEKMAITSKNSPLNKLVFQQGSRHCVLT